MAYRLFNPGDEALAADINNYFMSQTVARFASAATRASAIASPAVNQLTALDTAKGQIDAWNGSAWQAISATYGKLVALNFNQIVVGTGTEFTITSFNMPIFGAIMLTGIARFDPGAGATAALNVATVDSGPTSSPGASFTQQWIGSQQPSNTYYGTVPFQFLYPAQNAGAACTLKFRAGCSNPSMGVQLTGISAFIQILNSTF